MDEIDDELEFVEALEVGKLRRIAGLNERIETGPNDRACSAAKYCLLTKKVSLRLLAKVVSITLARVNRSPLPKPGPSALRACWDFDGLLSGRARHALSQIRTHHGAQAFRRHHDDVHVSPGNDSAIMNREAMREE